MNSLIAKLGRRALGGGRLSRLDLLGLAEASRRCAHDLLYWANKIRTGRFGNTVSFCSIVPGKIGNCSEDCKWCAQSAMCAAPGQKPRRTPIAEIAAAARSASQLGAACLGIVNSGRRPAKIDLDLVIQAVSAIKAQTGRAPAADLQVCASLGELTEDQARRLAEAGVGRYHHNLETSRGFFPKVVTTHAYDDRLATLAGARRAGLSICCGGLFGLGETWADRVELAITLRDEVRPDIVPLNFLHPIPGTPLEKAPPLAPIDILSIIALFRLAMPQVDIKIAGGRQKNLRDLQSWVFYAGATSCIVGSYLTTSGRPPADDLQMVADLGLQVIKTLPAEPIAGKGD